MEINGYQLSRDWFDFCFENPDLINPSHTAIYFFAIEHCNRLGWKEKYGFPTQMTMDALGIKKHQTYIKYFNDLIEWGFIRLIQKSSNQYSANIISLQIAKPKNGKASGKALDKAFIEHAAKQGSTNGQSKDSIDKQITSKQRTKNKEPIVLPEIFLIENVKSAWDEWIIYKKEKKQTLTPLSLKKQINFLEGRAGPEIVAIINQSIMNGWIGLFELKKQDNGIHSRSNQGASGQIRTPDTRTIDYDAESSFK